MIREAAVVVKTRVRRWDEDLGNGLTERILEAWLVGIAVTHDHVVSTKKDGRSVPRPSS